MRYVKQGVFDDDEVRVESGRGSIYLLTGPVVDGEPTGVTCMLSLSGGLELAQKIIEAVEASA